jgi:hypothetical protein
MKGIAPLAMAGIIALVTGTLLITTLVGPVSSFPIGQSLSVNNMIARSSGHTGVVPTQPRNPPGQGTLNPQAKRVRPNPQKCYNSCMKGGGGTWSDVQFCAYSCL